MCVILSSPPLRPPPRFSLFLCMWPCVVHVVVQALNSIQQVSIVARLFLPKICLCNTEQSQTEIRLRNSGSKPLMGIFVLFHAPKVWLQLSVGDVFHSDIYFHAHQGPLIQGFMKSKRRKDQWAHTVECEFRTFIPSSKWLVVFRCSKLQVFYFNLSSFLTRKRCCQYPQVTMRASSMVFSLHPAFVIVFHLPSVPVSKFLPGLPHHPDVRFHNVTRRGVCLYICSCLKFRIKADPLST